MRHSRQAGLHRLNPFTRLVIALAFVLTGFLLPGLHSPILIFVLGVLPLAVWGRIAQKILNSCAQLVLPAAVTLFLLLGALSPEGKTPFLVLEWFRLTVEGISQAWRLTGQLLVLTGGFGLLIQTTPPGALMSALQQAGLPSQIAYMVSSSVYLLPHMQARAQSVLEAQQARGLRTRGSFLQRASGIIPLVAPLVYSMFITADERALALEVRAFGCVKNPTSWHEFADPPGEKFLRIVCVLMVLFAGGWRLWQSLTFSI